MSTPILGTPNLTLPNIMPTKIPIYIGGKNNTLTNDELYEMSLALKIYAGPKTYPATAANYTLNKDYAVNNVINFDVSKLLQGMFVPDFGQTSIYGFQTLTTNEVFWVAPTGDWEYSNNGDPAASAQWGSGNTYAFLVSNGWKFNNVYNASEYGISSPNLFPMRERYVLPNQYGAFALNNVWNINEESPLIYLYFILIEWNSDGNLEVLYNTATNPYFPAFNNDSTKSVVYSGVYPKNLNENPYLIDSARPSLHQVGEYYDILVHDSNGDVVFTQRFVLTCEPKYTPYIVHYVNRYGFIDTLTFFKRSDTSGQFTEESYKRQLDSNAFNWGDPDAYSATQGQYVSYNINSRNSHRLNTGFVGEDHKDVIEDILMSDFVVFEQSDGTFTPVVPERGSIEYQKHVNQKLINYTITFRDAYDQRWGAL